MEGYAMFELIKNFFLVLLLLGLLGGLLSTVDSFVNKKKVTKELEDSMHPEKNIPKKLK